MKLVSVIVPAYNRQTEIIQTLKTIIVQTYPNIEIIIVDDGSTDNTYEVAQEFINNYDGRFEILLYKQENLGLAGARNSGFKHSKGDYILFFDSDDLMLPDRCEIQVKSIEKNHADACAAAFYRQRDGQIVETVTHQTYPNTSLINQMLFFYLKGSGIRPSSQSWMFTRELFERMGGYDIRLRSNQDIDFAFRIALNGYKISIVNKPLSIFVDDDRPDRIMKSIWKSKKGVECRGIVADKLINNKIVRDDPDIYLNSMIYYFYNYIVYSLPYMGKFWCYKKLLNLSLCPKSRLKTMLKKMEFFIKLLKK